jgi:hypothetical protein
MNDVTKTRKTLDFIRSTNYRIRPIMIHTTNGWTGRVLAVYTSTIAVQWKGGMQATIFPEEVASVSCNGIQIS